MARKVPSYRLHKASGKAVVTINSRDYYLGEFGSQESKREYRRFITEWEATGRSTSFGCPADSVTIAMIAADYLEHCKAYYPRRYNSETESAKMAIGYLADYLDLQAKDFGPLKLKSVRQIMCEAKNKRTGAPQSRKYVNRLVGQIIRMMKWAVENELVEVGVYQALKAVPPLKRGRCGSPEGKGIRPVDDKIVERTIPYCPQVVADMIRVQRLTGMRPAEVCALTPGIIDRSGEVWIATPDDHKNAWRDKPREIYIGPKCQAILRPYLLRSAAAYLFSPAESEEKRRQARSESRVIPLGQGNRPGTNRKSEPKRAARKHYTTDSYRRAIHRACEKAFDMPKMATQVELAEWEEQFLWSPNRLRHSAGTEIRKQFGVEAARVVLGHTDVQTTEIYAEIDREKAMSVAVKIG